MNAPGLTLARAEEILRRPARIMVIGDVMLDETIQVTRRAGAGNVFTVRNDVERADVPGGAANVAMNLKALGQRVELLGVMGRGPAGNRLEKALGRGTGPAIARPLLRRLGRVTTLKTRYVQEAEVVSRVDREMTAPILPEV